MAKGEFFNKLSKCLWGFKERVSANSPKIFTVAGVVGLVGAGVLACVETPKAKEAISEHKKQMEVIDQSLKDGKTVDKDDNIVPYSAKDARQDTIATYVRTVGKLGKIYWKPITIAVVSAISIFGGQRILSGRYKGAVASAVAVSNEFKEYRDRVKERIGDEAEKEVRYNIKAKQVEEEVTDDNGKTKTVKKKVKVADPNSFGRYTRMYDDGCKGWTKDPEHNKIYLQNVQAAMTRRLQLEGHLYLCDVLEALGFPITYESRRVGWFYDEENPIGDNYVDFGIFDGTVEKKRDFVNGYERCIILDFNVDGYIDQWLFPERFKKNPIID